MSPYIKQEERNIYDEELDILIELLSQNKWCVGQVNFCFTRIIVAWFNELPRYRTINSIAGVLRCVWDEFYHRIGKVYENERCVETGDVYQQNEVTCCEIDINDIFWESRIAGAD